MAVRTYGIRDRLYLLLLLAFIPMMLWPGRQSRKDLDIRLEETINAASPETKARLDDVRKYQDSTLFDLLQVLPDGCLVGAHLPHGSRRPWAYAAAAAGAFWLVLLILFPTRRSDASPLQLLTVMSLTGTVGAMLLIGAQGIAGEFFFAANAEAPASPEATKFWFIVGYCGFIIVAALLEEVGKLLPVFVQYAASGPLSWRAAIKWGLAAGAGLGAMEGCLYAQSGYNGVWPSEVYVTRFVSGVTLHAVWSGAAALTLHRHYRELAAAENAVVSIGLLFHFALPTTILHSAYNLGLSYGPDWSGAVVAGLSFAWMAWQIERCRAGEAVKSTHPAAVY